MGKDYYQLHAVDVNATTDPNDGTPIWLDLFYFGNDVALKDMKELNIEIRVGDAKKIISMLEAAINLVKTGRDYSMYDG